MKKVFLEISQNLKENTCAIVSFQIKLQAEACIFIKMWLQDFESVSGHFGTLCMKKLNVREGRWSNKMNTA